MTKKQRKRLDQLIKDQKSEAEYGAITLSLFGNHAYSLYKEDDFLKATGFSKDFIQELRLKNHISFSETQEAYGSITYRYWFTYITFESLLIRGYISKEKYNQLMADWNKICEEEDKKYNEAFPK